jgi:hypothetical protein
MERKRFAVGTGPANLAGRGTYRQQAPASCPLPAQHRNVALAATLTAQGGNVYVMSLEGTDGGSSYSFFYWAGANYHGNILYTRTTSEFVVFSVNEAPFTLNGSTLSSAAAGEYQYMGATLVDCMGTFTITLTR